MTRNWLPAWARYEAAQAAVDEALERSERVDKQLEDTTRVARRLWIFGDENHFQQTVRNMFGVHK